MTGFLLDENVHPACADALRRDVPDVRVFLVGRPDAPPKGTLDPDILLWCEQHDCLLVTHNRRTMPGHLADHLTSGHHVPGLLLIRRNATLPDVVFALVLIALASGPSEFEDRMTNIPF